jgi:hypothetical protein
VQSLKTDAPSNILEAEVEILPVDIVGPTLLLLTNSVAVWTCMQQHPSLSSVALVESSNLMPSARLVSLQSELIEELRDQAAHVKDLQARMSQTRQTLQIQ